MTTTTPDLDILLARLATCDTPTVCNAIEVAQGKRGFEGFTHRTMLWSGPSDARIVGFARTARIAGRVPPTDSKVFGLQGAVTNGVMRDLGDMPDGFPVLAGSVGPSHGFVHVREIATPVTVFGMRVCEGDLIHADRHGAVAVPQDVLSKLSAALDVLFSSEDIILGPIRDGTVSIDEFEALWAAFEAART